MEKPGLEQYYLNEEFSDVHFKVAGERLPAHKVILSTKSPVFEHFLHPNGHPEISVEKISSLAVRSMLRFVYGDGRVAADVDDDALAQLCHLAEAFLVTNLTSALREAIRDEDRYRRVAHAASKMAAFVTVMGESGIGTTFVGRAAAETMAGNVATVASNIVNGPLATGVRAFFGQKMAESSYATELRSFGFGGGLPAMGSLGLAVGALASESYDPVGVGLRTLGVFGAGAEGRSFGDGGGFRQPEADHPFERYYLKEESSDVTFLVGDEKIAAHRIILSLQSGAFRSLFLAKHEKRIEMEEATPTPFKTMLKYVYCREFVHHDATAYETVARVHQLAQRFQLRGLIFLTEDWMRSRRPLQNLYSFDAMGHPIVLR